VLSYALKAGVMRFNTSSSLAHTVALLAFPPQISSKCCTMLLRYFVRCDQENAWALTFLHPILPKEGEGFLLKSVFETSIDKR